MCVFKRHNLGLISTIFLLATAVVACRGKTPTLPTPPASSPSPTQLRTPTLQPPPSPTSTSAPSKVSTPQPSDTICPSCDSIEDQAREALANWLGISSEEIEVVQVEEVEWPDTSLGCPEPGMAYTQVIMQGCRITLEAAGETYEVHTGGQRMVVCDEENLPLSQ